MKLFKQVSGILFGVLLGVIIGATFDRSGSAKAQDPKDSSRHEIGKVSMTPIYPTPAGKVTLFQTDRYLGFSCTQNQCYVASME